MISDKEIQRVIQKDSSLDWIKKKHPIHYRALQIGAYLIKNNISNLEELETLINIKDKLLNK